MSSLPKAIEGLTDVSAQVGDLKFVMSTLIPGQHQEQAPLTCQDRVRRAFVLQASLMFDAKEIKYVIENKKERLPAHLKTMCDRNIPWITDLIASMPDIILALNEKDQQLSVEFEELKEGGVLEHELTSMNTIVKKLQMIVQGGPLEGPSVDTASKDCDLLISVASSLFPLFSRAKDALGVKKAQGAI